MRIQPLPAGFEGDDAIAACSRLIQRDPKDAAAYTNRGRAYFAKNADDRAVADYSQAIRLDPKNAVAYSARGLTYTRRWVFHHEKRDFDRAIADRDQAIRPDPKDANAYSSRGLAHYAKADGRIVCGTGKAAGDASFPFSWRRSRDMGLPRCRARSRLAP